MLSWFSSLLVFPASIFALFYHQSDFQLYSTIYVDPDPHQRAILFLISRPPGQMWLFVVAVKLLSQVQLCDPMECCSPGFPSFTISWNLLKSMSIELVLPSNCSVLDITYSNIFSLESFLGYLYVFIFGFLKSLNFSVK